MIKIAVVDDEKIMLDKICKIIDENFTEDKTIRSFESSMEFFNDADKYSFDIVFLDIDMPEIDGFQLAESIKAVQTNAAIIFVSNMEHLVFESIKFQPFRFIKKESIEKDMREAIHAYIEKNTRSDDGALFFFNGISASVKTTDIIYFESLGHDIYMKTLHDHYKLKRDSQNMKTLCDQFNKKGFIRIHKSYLVNYKYIFIINRNDVVLKTNEKISINPHNAIEIKKAYQKQIMKEDGI